MVIECCALLPESGTRRRNGPVCGVRKGKKERGGKKLKEGRTVGGRREQRKGERLTCHARPGPQHIQHELRKEQPELYQQVIFVNYSMFPKDTIFLSCI